MKTTFIYALLNTEGTIDYIGKSNNPKRRFKEHARRGFVLATVPFSDWKQYETFFITRFLELGGVLRNKNFGGGGCTQHTEEIRVKLSAVSLGKKKSLAHCAAIGSGHRGKIVSAETRAKLRAANLGKKLSQEQRNAISIRQLGKKRSQETCEKLRAANLGLKHSALRCEKNREAQLGKKLSLAHRAAISAAQLGKKKPSFSAERCSAISIRQLGKKRGPYRAKLGGR